MVAFANERKPLFDLGQIVATPGALEVLRGAGIDGAKLLARHQLGDFGDLSPDDKKANDDAVNDGSRILSSYKISATVKLWIITDAADDEGHRACTTILLPDEY